MKNSLFRNIILGISWKQIHFLVKIILLVCIIPQFAQGQISPTDTSVDNRPDTKHRYQFSLDLRTVRDDKLFVSTILPPVPAHLRPKNTVIYCMPRIVPGTYAIYNFGRFLTKFKAYDKYGNQLPFQKLNDNEWKIGQADMLHKITYWVEDTYDTQKPNVIFEPSGTNIEKNKNFVLNTFGFFGYLKGLQRLTFEVTIQKPATFYGSTALKPVHSTSEKDVFLIKDYWKLVDSPMMYNVPDTVLLQVGSTEVLVSVYSPKEVLSAKYVADNIKDILIAQKNYLGGKLPVKRYAFIIYLFRGESLSGAMGALEHSYSSMYYLPEMSPHYLAQTIRDVAAHEFFHILTPLNLHSEEIHNFDFLNPKMSKHLWLYEGVVEYFSGHVQVSEELMSVEKYLQVIRNKMFSAQRYDEQLPFTELSSGCLDKYADQYQNVYEKGALIALCIDLKLLHLSNGEYGLRDLLKDLAIEYGKDIPFKDEELFGKITDLTYPVMDGFLRSFVSGANPLPFEQIFDYVGIIYKPTETQSLLSLGNVELALDGDYVVISDASQMDALGETLGYQEGDRILKINGTEIDRGNARETIETLRKTGKVGDRLSLVIEREIQGEWKKLKLKAYLIAQEFTESFTLELNSNPTDKQLQIRKAWLQNNQSQR